MTDNGGWKVYKSLCTGRWVVWNLVWGMTSFDTWQRAMDYVDGRLK